MKLKLLCAFLLCSLFAAAQQFQVRNYNTANGLLNSTVYRIFQDHKGYMWFCTDAGVSSFDGKTFASNLSISDSNVFSSALYISEMDDGKKIVTTYHHGLFILTDTSDETYSITKGHYPLYTLYSVPLKDKIWVIGRDSIQRLYKISGHSIEPSNIRDAKGANVHFNKFIKYGDRILCATSNGVYAIHDTLVSPLVPAFQEEAIDIKGSKSGHYWIALKHSVIEADDEKIIRRYDIGDNKLIGNILCDSHNNVWISVYGESMLLIKDGVVRDITHTLPMSYINDLYEDREGNIWLATYNNGVFMIPSTDVLSYLFDNVSNTFCSSLSLLDSNSLLVGSIGKVGICANGKISSLSIPSLERNEFVYFAKYINSNIYVSTPFKLIVKKNKQHGDEILQLPHNSGPVSIYQDNKGKIWLGGFESIYTLDDKNGHLEATLALRGTGRCNAELQDHSGNLWFATASGLYIYDGHNYKLMPDTSRSTMKDILNLYEDTHNRIWAATAHGLICFDDGKMHIFKTNDGLLSNKCFALVENNNILWVGTAKGLNYIDLEKLRVKSYNEFFFNKKINTLFIKGNDTLFVGTTDNLYSIRLNFPTNQQILPPVYITAVKTSNSRFINPSSISLPYNENKVIIDYIYPSFKNSGEIEYRYMVKNLDEKWHTTTNTTIELAGLPSGNYEFVLNVRKRNEEWGPNVILPITIATPFWKRLWFIALISCTAIALVYMISKAQIQRTERKKREQLLLLNKMTYLKQQALSALINPHFIFNCMNSIQHFMNRKDTDKANSYLADFAHLIRLTMENAQDAFIMLDKELRRLELYLSLEQLRFGDDLKFNITADASLNAHNVFIPNMIIQPFVENSIWHGIMPKDGKGIISIHFNRLSKDELSVVIKDNGIGINNSRKKAAKDDKQHYGIKLTEERLSLLQQLSNHNYKIIIKENEEEGGGTVVTIILPVTTEVNLFETD